MSRKELMRLLKCVDSIEIIEQYPKHRYVLWSNATGEFKARFKDNDAWDEFIHITEWPERLADLYYETEWNPDFSPEEYISNNPNQLLRAFKRGWLVVE